MGQNSSGKLFRGQVPQFFLKTVMMTQQQRHYSVDNVTLIHASWQCSRTALFKAVGSDFNMCGDC